MLLRLESQVRGPARVNWKLELPMTSRHFIGDLALAILLSIPVAAIAATSHAVHDVTPTSLSQVSCTSQSPVADRFTLFAPN